MHNYYSSANCTAKHNSSRRNFSTRMVKIQSQNATNNTAKSVKPTATFQRSQRTMRIYGKLQDKTSYVLKRQIPAYTPNNNCRLQFMKLQRILLQLYTPKNVKCSIIILLVMASHSTVLYL